MFCIKRLLLEQGREYTLIVEPVTRNKLNSRLNPITLVRLFHVEMPSNPVALTSKFRFRQVD